MVTKTQFALCWLVATAAIYALYWFTHLFVTLTPFIPGTTSIDRLIMVVAALFGFSTTAKIYGDSYDLD